MKLKLALAVVIIIAALVVSGCCCCVIPSRHYYRIPHAVYGICPVKMIHGPTMTVVAVPVPEK